MKLFPTYFFLFLLTCFSSSASAQHYNFKKYATKNGLANSTVQQIIQDKDGYIWFATSGGLSSFDGKKFKNYYASNGLPTNDITCLLEDQNKNLWIGTTSGLCKYDGVKFTSVQGYGLNHLIYSIYQDAALNIWFSTNGGGLIRYNGKKFNQITKTNGLPTDTIFSILQDHEQN